MAPLLEIKGLKTHFSTDDGMLQAVDGVDIAINKGETLCVVGESGCGKTVTAMSILKLIAMPPGRIVEGQILFEGRDLVPLTSNELDDIRAKEIGFIFQEPMTSLNPVLTVGEQVAESPAPPRGPLAARRRWPAPWRCSSWCRSPMPPAACTITRTSSRAACASAS